MTISDWIHILAATLTLVLLIVAAVSDITRYRIPNTIVYAIVAAFAVGAIANFAWPAIVWPVAAGLVVFVVGAVLFAFGMFGGGDVKLLAAMALWTGFADLPRFLLIMGVAGGLIGLVLLLKRRRQEPAMANAAPAPAESSQPEAAVAAAQVTEAPRPTRKSHIPYGVGIAIAGLDFFLISPHSPLAPLWPWMQ